MWNEGYVSEIDYVFGYFPEMSPARLKLALLSRGIGHNVSTSPSYLELGFGQGLSLAINATTASGDYYGTDFNPSQAGNAMRFAQASGKPVQIFDNSFEAFAARDDLPAFDMIALHGIWSWVSDKGREAILKIVDERLKPGGMLYMSYNVVPGWSPLMPLRHLLWEHHQRAGSGGVVNRMDAALAFVDQVRNMGTGYFGAQPGASGWLDVMKGQDRNYLAHEYFNAQWRPESFADVSDRLAGVKLTYGASANILENIAERYLPSEMTAMLATIDDPTLRELTKDFLVNRKFRTDVFVKGARTLTANEVSDTMCSASFVRTGLNETLPSSLNFSFCEVPLRTDIFEPIARFMEEAEGGVASFVELCSVAKQKDMHADQLIEALMALVGTGYLALATDSDTIAEDYFASLRFNREMCRQARYSGQAQYLAAPGIGAGIKVGRLELIALHALASGFEDVAEYMLETLQGQHETVQINGAPACSDQEALEHLRLIAEGVRAELLPKLERLGAVATCEGNPFAVPAIELAASDPALSGHIDNGGALPMTA
ncbi:MAG TPA: class I SAM-dependent methyltransferase [Croceibacterium sp.]|nr:class I SAM-dependent methyltransferase [Croceibacterium sp.]